MTTVGSDLAGASQAVGAQSLLNGLRTACQHAKMPFHDGFCSSQRLRGVSHFLGVTSVELGSYRRPLMGPFKGEGLSQRQLMECELLGAYFIGRGVRCILCPEVY